MEVTPTQYKWHHFEGETINKQKYEVITRNGNTGNASFSNINLYMAVSGSQSAITANATDDDVAVFQNGGGTGLVKDGNITRAKLTNAVKLPTPTSANNNKVVAVIGNTFTLVEQASGGSVGGTTPLKNLPNSKTIYSLPYVMTQAEYDKLISLGVETYGDQITQSTIFTSQIFYSMTHFDQSFSGIVINKTSRTIDFDGDAGSFSTLVLIFAS